MTLTAIALGSNLGDREANLRHALVELAQLGVVREVSSFHDTEPVGYLNQPRFLNAAAVLETKLAASDLLRQMLAIELRMGRDRKAVVAKGPRVIDLDLLFYGDAVIGEHDLIVPHPAMPEREFVLTPLAEIAADWVHPVTGKTVGAMLAGVREQATSERR